MNAGRRALADRALHDARVSAYPAGQYVEQESFMTASDILTLAKNAGIGPGTDVLDVCCGVAGPGRFLTRRLGCRYLGVDECAGAIALARERAGGLPCRFVTAAVPPVPAGRYDVVLLLETLLAFRDKRPLVSAIAGALSPGGRFACTVEEGAPLTGRERAAMPRADTVWPVPLPQLESLLSAAGLTVRWRRDDSRSQLRVVDDLTDAFSADRQRLAAALGAPAVDDLLTAHHQWGSWLRSGRIRKFALVAHESRAHTRGSRPGGYGQ